jgi:hypothetical protein
VHKFEFFAGIPEFFAQPSKKVFQTPKKMDISKHKECVECEQLKPIFARGMCR